MKRALLVVAAILASSLSARAQDGTWQLKLTPYVWAANIKGNVGVNNVTVPVDVKFADAIKKMDLAGMLGAEANNGKWGVLFDGSYLKLSDDANTSIGKVSAHLEQWILQGSAVYRVYKNEKTVVDAGAGARSMDQHVELESPAGSPSQTKNWCDPILVARVRQQFATHCYGVLSGDIGGFGVSSDLTWQLTAAAGYSFTDTISMLIGYRYLGYDYNKDGFKYDVGTQGFGLGLQFIL